MASRLVFAMYMQHHGAAGAQTLLEHGRKWGEHGGFPYGASAAALARLRPDEDAAEDFFRQELAVFARGQEGVFGVREFAGLLERAVALEAISDESAEEAGQAVVAQLGRLAGIEASGSDGGTKGAAAKDAAASDAAELTGEEQRQVAEALNDVRLSAPKAYAKARKDWPGLFAAPGRAGADGDAGTAAAPTAGAGSGNAALPAAGARRVTRAAIAGAGVDADAGVIWRAGGGDAGEERAGGFARGDCEGFATGERPVQGGRVRGLFKTGCAVVGAGFAGGVCVSDDDCGAVEGDRRAVLACLLFGDCGAAGGRADAGGRSDGSQGAGEGRGGAGVMRKGFRVSRFQS